MVAILIVTNILIFTVGVLVGCGINQWAQNCNSNPLGLPTAKEMMDILEKAESLQGGPDPFADERPTSNGAVVDLGEGATMRVLDKDETPKPHAEVHIPDDPEQGKAEDLRRAVEILRTHVGHDVSIVEHSMGSAGILICNTCKVNVSLPSRTVLTAVQAGAVDVD